MVSGRATEANCLCILDKTRHSERSQCVPQHRRDGTVVVVKCFLVLGDHVEGSERDVVECRVGCFGGNILGPKRRKPFSAGAVPRRMRRNQMWFEHSTLSVCFKEDCKFFHSSSQS
jgi:hypothetical protein